MQQQKFKITQESIERTSGTEWYEVELSINNKNVNISMWFSYDREVGETDKGYEILDDSDTLTEEEREQIKEFIEEGNIKLIGE